MGFKRFCTIVLGTTFLFGCSAHLGTLSYTSTKRQEVDTRRAYQIGTDQIGENVHWFVLIDPTFTFPKVDKAVEDALAKTGGDFMTNATITYKWFFIPILYYRLTMEVKGDIWKIQPEK